MSEPDSANPTVRRAVLVFADSLAKDLNRRGWSKRLSSLLNLPRVDSQQIDADVHLFTTGIGARVPFGGATVHAQRGKTFGERLSNAFDKLAQRGYEQIVIVGRDCPELTVTDIQDAFRALRKSRAVLGPDHRGGCYLIGLHATDRALLDGIQWQQNTDFYQLLTRIGMDHIVCLAVKFDLDSLADVNLIASRSHSWTLLLQSLLCQVKRFTLRVPRPSIQPDQRTRWQIPPPSILRPFAAH
jgi:glycosyltransferase A (GT-A) superfamily protein (DUF2064 family)